MSYLAFSFERLKDIQNLVSSIQETQDISYIQNW